MFKKDMLSYYTAKMKPSMIRELVSIIKNVPDVVSFAGGFPAPSTFPVEELSELFSKAIIEDGTEILQYGASEGDPQLLKAIVDFEKIPGLKPENVLPTNGATNSIYYIARALIDPGDLILCEAPSFLGSLVTYEAMGAQICGINLENDGINLIELKNQIIKAESEGKKIKLLYLIPDFQNPSGVTTSLDKRRKIIELAINHNFIILEDNPYGLLRYNGDHLPEVVRIAWEEFHNRECVISVRSMSKILGPGLRIAYAIGHEELINALTSWTQKINISACGVTQRVVSRFLPKLNHQVESIIDTYRDLRDFMLSSLDKYMPDVVKWTKPEGGMFIWLTLPKKINTDKLFHKAVEAKVAFIPGSRFYPAGNSSPSSNNSLRLNFSYAEKEKIEKGVKILADLIEKELDR